MIILKSECCDADIREEEVKGWHGLKTPICEKCNKSCNRIVKRV